MCDLIVVMFGRGLKEFSLECCGWIKDTSFVGERVFECMVRGLSLVGMVEDAEKVLDEMCHLRFKPSGIEYRVVIQGYGWLGSFKEMRVVTGRMEDAEIGIYTVCANLVLSCYGTLPLSMDDLLEMLNDEEALLVKELAGASVLLEKLT
ncbi:uncharacterized protein A4U43_C03F17580 [Asparagus officinalis]|uniref:Pentatricopeptide repeat-containing protein n=1 Tax=Asparagus officinalis TaxID=4686 RepID=A0A5P1FCM5_ASPOF|nr:uncharacterized protein A4U43_C03F17580 [Asparagus officinalis]